MSKDRNETPVYSREMGLIQRIEYSVGNAVYIGMAFPNTSTSATSWQIKKLTYDGDGNMTALDWCSGSDDFRFSWDLRASYTYS